MFASTLPISLCLIGLICGLVMQRVGWGWLCYGLIAFVAIACLRQGTLHLQYTGIEVAAFGWLLTFLDPLRFVRKRVTPIAAKRGSDQAPTPAR